jgi:acyl-coenzyme A thioesterase PaaI-like protein
VIGSEFPRPRPGELPRAGTGTSTGGFVASAAALAAGAAILGAISLGARRRRRSG